MTGITLQEKFMPEIMRLLELKHMTVYEMSDSLKANHHTVRGALRRLMDQGLVIAADNYHRNTKYKLQNDDGPNRIIPTITTNGRRYKLHELIRLKDTEKPSAVVAVENLPLQITRIFHAAMSVHAGGPAPVLTLDRIREQMEHDMEALKTVVDVYKQILSNPGTWDPEILMRYPNDVSFDEDLVKEAYTQYFKE